MKSIFKEFKEEVLEVTNKEEMDLRVGEIEIVEKENKIYLKIDLGINDILIETKGTTALKLLLNDKKNILEYQYNNNFISKNRVEKELVKVRTIEQKITKYIIENKKKEKNQKKGCKTKKDML